MSNTTKQAKGTEAKGTEAKGTEAKATEAKARTFNTLAFDKINPETLGEHEAKLYNLVAEKIKKYRKDIDKTEKILETEVKPFLSSCKTMTLNEKQNRLNERVDNINKKINTLLAQNLQGFSSQNVAKRNLALLNAQIKATEARELHGAVYGNSNVYSKLSSTKKALVDRFVVKGGLPSIDLTMAKTKGEGEVYTSTPLKGTEGKAVEFTFKMVANKKGKKKLHLIIK